MVCRTPTQYERHTPNTLKHLAKLKAQKQAPNLAVLLHSKPVLQALKVTSQPFLGVPVPSTKRRLKSTSKNRRSTKPKPSSLPRRLAKPHSLNLVNSWAARSPTWPRLLSLVPLPLLSLWLPPLLQFWALVLRAQRHTDSSLVRFFPAKWIPARSWEKLS